MLWREAFGARFNIMLSDAERFALLHILHSTLQFISVIGCPSATSDYASLDNIPFGVISDKNRESRCAAAAMMRNFYQLCAGLGKAFSASSC